LPGIESGSVVLEFVRNVKSLELTASDMSDLRNALGLERGTEPLG
jgi:hypothetical protein